MGSESRRANTKQAEYFLIILHIYVHCKCYPYQFHDNSSISQSHYLLQLLPLPPLNTCMFISNSE